MHLSVLENWIINNQIDPIVEMVTQDASVLQQPSSLGISLLRFAYLKQRPQIAQFIAKHQSTWDIFDICTVGKFEDLPICLIKHPDALNSYAADGFTPLALACIYGYVDMVKWLLLKGAAPNLATSDKNKNTPLHWAIVGNQFEISQVLIEHHADINKTQNEGLNALHYAAMLGNIELIVLLLEHGAKLDTKTNHNKTAADIAAEQGFTEISNLLTD
jgi:ankyrin repeat protein